MDFNFEGKDYAEIFGISEERATAIAEKFSDCIVKIGDNPSGFYCQCEKCSAKKDNDKGLHTGLILKELMDGITAENEIFFAVNQLEKVVELIEKRMRHKEINEALKKVLGNLFKL